MNIAGLIKHSLIDYPGEIAAVIFTQGCNFRCGFCHNPDLLAMNKNTDLSEVEILAFIEKRARVLDGVVITGGEPTLQTNLFDFIRKIKAWGLKVKLDTNGSNPKLLNKLIEDGLIDYVAMDVKGSLESYPHICAYLNTKVIQESINILLKSSINYEFRTTVLPCYHDKPEIEKIAKLISGAKRFTLQGFRPEITYDKSLSNQKSFTKNELHELAEVFKPEVAEVIVLDNL